MEWYIVLTVLGAWVGVMSLIIGAAALLRTGTAVKEETKAQLRGLLTERNSGVWVQAANRSFLHLFDRFYRGQGTRLEQLIWVSLLSSLAILILIRLSDAPSADRSFTTSGLLTFAIFLAFFLGLFQLVTTLPRTIARVMGSAVAVASIIFIGGIIAIVISIAIYGRTVMSSGILIAILIAMPFASVGGLAIVLSDLSQKVGWLSRIPVHPMKGLASSLVFLAMLGLLRLDATSEFVDAIADDGFILAFVAFNIFADAVSLVETRWVLQKGANAGIRKLLGWLVIDLALSAMIFLLLPLVLWEIPAFLEAALFQGPRPWLGILFWSTFSTSVVFYVFVVSALLLRLLHPLVRAVRGPINVQEEPVVGLAITMGVVVTFVFLVAGGTALGQTIA